jgi:hypothetical protein
VSAPSGVFHGERDLKNGSRIDGPSSAAKSTESSDSPRPWHPWGGWMQASGPTPNQGHWNSPMPAVVAPPAFPLSRGSSSR